MKSSISLKVSNKIYYLYFVMAVMIFGLHSVYMDLFKVNDKVLVFNQIFRIFWNMAVPTFFFVSALLFYQKPEKRKYMEVVKRKFKTLMVPYLLWNVICWPLKELKNILQTGRPEETSCIVIIKKILFSEWDPVLWFIRVLFIYFLIYPIILWIVRKKRCFWLIVILNVALNIWMGPTKGYSTMRYWLPVYMMGAYMAYWHYDCIFNETAIIYRNIGIASIILILLIIFAYRSDLGLYICRMLSPFCFWKIADVFLREKKPFWWMKQTFYYYCAQMIFSIVAQKIYLKIFGNSWGSAILAHILIPIILLSILAFTAYFLHRFLNPFWKVLTGARKE